MFSKKEAELKLEKIKLEIELLKYLIKIAGEINGIIERSYLPDPYNGTHTTCTGTFNPFDIQNNRN